ncbi:uncharacterized protein LOC112043382 isoform X2 [Bicyclus anynana]|uniref:Uncharacterized protein LOC112043382 isoform X2 n=1 Tax=Bicyclus anynana TaxID=110368 RepID=A0A6J1MH57_BICAN|nr:uncharacterized protein LOC112043382 isoform X2 [Bicyclus anynana]
MHILCSICSDLLNQAENIYVTKCGHMFHYQCLSQWIERSRTCPQCRNKVTERCMYRLFPNVSNEAGGEDVATLQSRLDDVLLKLRQHRASCKEHEDKAAETEAQLNKNVAIVKSLEKQLAQRETAFSALKEQLEYLKIQNSETQKLKEENENLKKNMQTLNGNQENAAEKRNHLGPSSGEPSKKRARLNNGSPNQPHLSVAVTTTPRLDFTQSEANAVQAQIQMAIFEACNVVQGIPYAPAFKGKAFLSEGVLKMWCQDDEALLWLKKCISTLVSPKPGTSLSVIPQTDIPIKVRSGLYVPDFNRDMRQLHQVLKMQNPWYKIMAWTLYSCQKTVGHPPGVFLILGIPKEEVPNLLARGRRVAYSTGSIYIRFFTDDGMGEQPPGFEAAEVDQDNQTSTPDIADNTTDHSEAATASDGRPASGVVQK